MRPTEHELREFINALQLSIEAEIKGAKINGDITIEFDRRIDDDNFGKFMMLVDCSLEDEGKKCVVRGIDKVDWLRLTLFLLLTRLDDRNMSKLVEIDPSMAEVAKGLDLKSFALNLQSVEACSQMIFHKIKEKGMTIRELSEKTGLTQVSINNFRAGGDIKLSNFIRIIQALDLDLTVS